MPDDEIYGPPAKLPEGGNECGIEGDKPVMFERIQRALQAEADEEELEIIPLGNGRGLRVDIGKGKAIAHPADENDPYGDPKV